MPACKALLIPLPPSRFLRWLGAPAQHYLRIGLAISLLVHAGALAWRFGAPALSKPASPGLEVLLLNARSETPPETPRAQAQNQMSGGGNAERGLATTRCPRPAPRPRPSCWKPCASARSSSRPNRPA